MKKINSFLAILLISLTGLAQEQDTLKQNNESEGINTKIKGLSVTVYIQPQFQWGEQDASLKVGGSNNNPNQSFNRFGIRRGRLKFDYKKGIASGVFQLNITDKGIVLKDAYVAVEDPWAGTNSFKLGVSNRTFGYEVQYSSSERESLERSTIFQTLFPEERDLGAVITLQAPESSAIHFLKLEAGLFSGNGAYMDIDNKKDFIGHLSASDKWGVKMKWGLGVSYYYGGVYQGTENVYRMNGDGYELNNDLSNIGGFARREYFGVDAQFSFQTALGETKLTGEYLIGTQPGSNTGSRSPNSPYLPSEDTYLREFNGGYAMLVQDLGISFLAGVLKYDWYNPNTKVAGNNIGLNFTNEGDIAYQTLGFGLLWRINKNLRLQAFYESVRNEISSNLAGYESDRNDDVFTLRLQYKL